MSSGNGLTSGVKTWEDLANVKLANRDKLGRTPPPRINHRSPPKLPAYDSLAIALELAADGLPVFPCNAHKKPAIAKAKGGNGFRDASTDPDRIRELWRLAGNAAQLVGVPTGAASGRDILDIDPKNNGTAWEQDNADRLDETRIHQTPSTGRHYVFHHADGVRNSTSKLAPGVDVRGEGGYAIHPPSAGYKAISDAEIADWPDWLLALVRKASEPPPRPEPYTAPAEISDKRIEAFVRRELDRVAGARDGEKHTKLRDASLQIGGIQHLAHLTDTEATQLLIAALPATVRDWDNARRTIAWGLAEGRKRPIALEERQPPRAPKPAPKPAAPSPSPRGPEAEPDKSDAIWNPWDDPPLPNWPGGVLPRQFEDTIAAICLRDGLDFPALAMSYIAAASGAAPKDARFSPFQGDAWRVPPIVWLMLVAESGQRKTQTLNHAMSMIKQRHGERWREYRDALKAWKQADPKERGDKPEEPPPYYTNDITVERLQQLLAENDRGMLYCRDELASLLDFGRYSQSKGDGPRAFFLEAYEGGPHTVHRVGRDTVFIPNAALTVVGGIQPSRLAAFKGLESDGLLQRFAVVCAGPIGREKPELVVKGKDLLDARIDRLLAMPFTPHRYHTDAEGGALITGTRQEGEAYAALPDFGVGFQGFANKLHGTHARLALILHMMELPERSDIPMETVERAGRLTRFLLRHAARFYGAIPSSGLETMRAVASFLLRCGLPRVRAGDLTAKVRPCRGMGLKELAALLSPLVAGGWIAPEAPFPDNFAWLITPGLPQQFGSRFASETARAAEVRRLIRGVIPDESDNSDGNGASPYTA